MLEAQQEPVDTRILDPYVSDEAMEDKQLKRTWEEEYKVLDGQISMGMINDCNNGNWCFSYLEDP